MKTAFVLQIYCKNKVHKECSGTDLVLGVFLECPTKSVVKEIIEKWENSRTPIDKSYYEVTHDVLVEVPLLN